MFPAALLITALNGQNGLIVNGVAPAEQIGRSLSFVGDLDKDGIDDLAIGAPLANGGSGPKSGKVYVVFGKRGGWRDPLNLRILTRAEGITISGLSAGSEFGFSVSGIGDINGDRVDDLVIGAPFVTLTDTLQEKKNVGQAYVIFGQWGRYRFPPRLDVSTLDGRNGFVVNGQTAGDQLGYAVSGADLNGDRLDDLIVGAPFSQLPDGNRTGQSVVIFGRRNKFDPVFDWTTLKDWIGFAITGALPGERSGFALARAGDINGDGLADVVIGAPFANARGYSSGRSYVVFGNRIGWGDRLDLSRLNGRNGFTLNGFVPRGLSGYSVSGAGDLNGDGVADLLIGAPFAEPNGFNSGQSYAVFGQRGGFPPIFDLSTLNGFNGWTLNGTTGRSGFAVAGLGDINGDRLSDLLVGAPFALGRMFADGGQGYVIYGNHTRIVPPLLSLGQLNPKVGFSIYGRLPEEALGYAVAGQGDFNGDQLPDFALSAPLATANGVIAAGQVYVILGQPPKPPEKSSKPPEKSQKIPEKTSKPPEKQPKTSPFVTPLTSVLQPKPLPIPSPTPSPQLSP